MVPVAIRLNRRRNQVKRITVEVREDHLENLAQTKPILALAELIWNALDAEATEIRIEFEENDLQGLDAIRVRCANGCCMENSARGGFAPFR